MIKILWTFAAIAMMFFSSPSDCPTALKEGVMFDCYNNGYKIEMTEKDVKEVDRLLCESLEGSRPMPAFGVSLHDDTLESVKNGIYLRFAFDGRQEVSGLQFDQLLIRINKDMYGISVTRGNNGRFEGRDFYIDIHKNLDGLYNFLKSLPVTSQEFSPDVDNAQISTGKLSENDLKIDENDLKIKEVSGGDLSANIPSVNKDKEKNTVISVGGQISAKKKRPFEDRIDMQKATAEELLLQSIDF